MTGQERRQGLSSSSCYGCDTRVVHHCLYPISVIMDVVRVTWLQQTCLTHPEDTIIIANTKRLCVHSTHPGALTILSCHHYLTTVWYAPYLYRGSHVSHWLGNYDNNTQPPLTIDTPTDVVAASNWTSGDSAIYKIAAFLQLLLVNRYDLTSLPVSLFHNWGEQNTLMMTSRHITWCSPVHYNPAVLITSSHDPLENNITSLLGHTHCD